MYDVFKKPGEAERLRDLHNLNVLDTAEDEDLDRLTQLAASVTGCPIALISLVDANRQWFKSKVGLEATGTSREVSFCSHAIRKPDDLFEIKDAKTHPDFKDNPLVTENPDIGFYAGYPIVTEEGSAIGTVCVIDHVAKSLTPLQKDQLKLISELAMAKIKELSLIRLQKEDVLEKEEELTNLSHEIRTPLTSVIGFSQALSEELEADVPSIDQIKNFSSLVSGSATQLLGLVRGMLKIAKDEKFQSEPKLARTNVTDLVAWIKASLEFVPLSDEVTFEILVGEDVPPEILSDGIYLNQILLNLISNAIKYTEVGHVRLSVRVNEVLNAIEFHVIDSGKGIPRDIQKAIFERFGSRREADNDKSVGIGLSIAAQKARKLGGKVFLKKSTVDEGSHFVFRVPRVGVAMKVDKVRTEPSVKSSQSLQGKSILVVDDAYENRLLLKVFLKDQDVRLLEAKDSHEALERLKEEAFNYILLDLNIGDENGYDLLDQIVESNLLNTAKVILFTGSVSAWNLDAQTQNPKIVGSLIKPFTKVELLESLKK